MKLSLYSIEQEYLKLADALMENGGEATAELEEALRLNKQDLQTKGVNYAMVIKQAEAENEIIDKEIARLNALKKTRNKVIERLKNNLATAMNLYDIEEIKSPIIKINFRNSKSVEIHDLKLLDRKFIKVSDPVESADKDAIKEALNNGETVMGAVIKHNKNIQIK